MAESIFQVWNRFQTSVNAGQTKVADAILNSEFRAVEYKVSFHGNNKTKSLVIKINKLQATIIDEVYSKSGDIINVAVNAVLNGSSTELVIINNEAYNLDVILLRAKF
jgi:hypothetical protein